MTFTAKRMRVWNWIVVVAMLFGALAPALGHALPSDPSSGPRLTAVCTSTGVKFVKVDASEDASPERQAIASSADCPFCLIAHFAAPPGPGSQLSLPPAGSAVAPLPPALADRGAAGVHHPAQPRAPPVSR